MSRTLALVSIISLILCGALFGLARVIGGDAVFHDSRNFAGIKPLIDLATRKEWTWDGGDSLTLEAPVNVVYRQNSPAGVTVTGDAQLLKHVKVGDGRIVSDAPPAKSGAPRLTAVIGGKGLRKFSVNGGENLDLGTINQDALDIQLNGHGHVTGKGRVARLGLTISGSGKAALGDLSVGDADVRIFGSGNGIIAPHGTLKLFVTGSGKIALATKPANIEQNVLGSGGIVDVGAIVDQVMASVPTTVTVPMPMPMAVPAPMTDTGDGRNFVTLGNKDVDLGRLDQKALTISIPTSRTVRAEGKVENLTVNIFGSGKAELGKLAAGNVTVHIFGSGVATVAPSGKLEASIMGSGAVHLRTKPQRIERSGMGSGQVIEDY